MGKPRHRPSAMSESKQKSPLEEWTVREKLYLASLACKHGNAWNSVARNMQAFVEKGRPEGWSNQKTCAAQFEQLMNELGADKRPKRNEPREDGNSNSVIYKKMAQKRIKELEENIIEFRKLWLGIKKDLDDIDDGSLATERSEQLKQKTQSTKTATVGESEKPLTRRESSRQNLEKTLAILCKEAAEDKTINLICKPHDMEQYNKVIKKHMDLSIIKKRDEVDDPHAVMNDLLLMFQNAIMFYQPDHQNYRVAVELRDKLVPKWEKALFAHVKHGISFVNKIS